MKPHMSNEEFRDRIKAIVGPGPPKADRPCVRKPTDRGYYPEIFKQDGMTRRLQARLASPKEAA